jgi:hypothetical protein
LEGREGEMCVGKTGDTSGTSGRRCGAGAKFKANAKRTKNRIVSLAPFLTVPPPMALNRRWRWIGGRDLAKAWGVLEGGGRDDVRVF